MALATRLNGVLAVVGTIPSGVGPELLCGELRTDDDQPWHSPSWGSNVTVGIRVAANSDCGLYGILTTLRMLTEDR